jgi:hypothetical protein
MSEARRLPLLHWHSDEPGGAYAFTPDHLDYFEAAPVETCKGRKIPPPSGSGWCVWVMSFSTMRGGYVDAAWPSLEDVIGELNRFYAGDNTVHRVEIVGAIARASRPAPIGQS